MRQTEKRLHYSPSKKSKGRILYIGTSYYNTWYLSRELRELGWKADVLTYSSENTDLYLHGYDFDLKDYVNPDDKFSASPNIFLLKLLKSIYRILKTDRHSLKLNLLEKLLKRWPFRQILKNLLRRFLKSLRKTQSKELEPLFNVLDRYDILQFTGVNNLRYFYFFNLHLFGSMPIEWDIKLLKLLGKKIVYSNIGCLDGVSQSSFRAWPPEPVCDICRWHDVPMVCSDERNLEWGRIRNSLVDYQIALGGNRKDYNDDPRVHEVPEFYCLDPEVWNPDLSVPPQYKLSVPDNTVKMFHAVGNFELRTRENNRNIKCTHIYVPMIDRLKAEGYKVELIFPNGVPNKELRFYQAQADIFLDMLTFGFFGATAREGMMLGKPVVCFLRPEWLESMRREIPEYVDELPVVSATPDTVYEILKDLIEHPEKRKEIGRRSREFAVKWHSAKAGARRLDPIYSDLLEGRKK